MIQDCTTIEEPGEYRLEDDLWANDGSVCLDIRTGDVTIEGNGNEIRSDKTDGGVGVYVDGPHGDGRVVLRDVTFRDWGEYGVEHHGPSLFVAESEFVNNNRGYRGIESGGTTMYHTEFRRNDKTVMSGQRMGEVRLHDVHADGGWTGFGTIDGADLTVTESSFTNMEGAGLSLHHSTTAELRDVEVSGNGGDGVFAASSGHSISVTIEDSTISENGGHGVNGENIRTEFGDGVVVRDTEIDDNRGKAIYTDPGDGGRADVIEGSGVDLGGGLVVSFDRQRLDLGTHGAPHHDTDALNVTGPDETVVTTEFTVGTDQGQLWYWTSEGWQSRGTYETTGGAFNEVTGPGTWAATSSNGSAPSGTPSGTETATNTPGDSGGDGPGQRTATPMPADSQTATPAPPGAPDDDRPTETEGRTYYPERPADSPQSPADVGTPADDDPAATATDDPDTGGDGDVVTPAEGTDDDGSMMDGAGFGPLVALFALLASALLVRRRS